MTAVICARIMAEHRLADEFNKELQAVVAKRAEVMAKLEVEGKKLLTQLTKEYVYEVKDALLEPFLPAEAKAGKPVRVVRRWTNSVQYKWIAKNYGVKIPDEPDVMVSYVYYRVNGVVVHLPGAGSSLLRVNVHTTDSEWDEITQGNIKSRFINQ